MNPPEIQPIIMSRAVNETVLAPVAIPLLKPCIRDTIPSGYILKEMVLLPPKQCTLWLFSSSFDGKATTIQGRPFGEGSLLFSLDRWARGWYRHTGQEMKELQKFGSFHRDLNPLGVRLRMQAPASAGTCFTGAGFRRNDSLQFELFIPLLLQGQALYGFGLSESRV